MVGYIYGVWWGGLVLLTGDRNGEGWDKPPPPPEEIDINMGRGMYRGVNQYYVDMGRGVGTHVSRSF